MESPMSPVIKNLFMKDFKKIYKNFNTQKQKYD